MGGGNKMDKNILEKIIDLGYMVHINMAWNKDGYLVSLEKLHGFNTKYEHIEYDKVENLEEGLNKIYDDVTNF